MQIVNQNNFETEILRSTKPVLLDIFATWCSPCSFALDVLLESEPKHPEIVFAKLNIDDAPLLLGSLQVKAVPTLILFKNGREANRFLGIPASSDIDELLK